jgi:fumarylpyruvate hydrolase
MTRVSLFDGCTVSGRNYAAHAREMGFDPDREPPFFFCKANDAQSIVPVPADTTVSIPYPSLTRNYHYEVELGRGDWQSR